MTQVEKIIRKYYLPKKDKKVDWEKCGMKIYELISEKETAIRQKQRYYWEECQQIDAMRNRIEKEYESFFGFANINGVVAGYDWIHGNSRLIKLLSN